MVVQQARSTVIAVNTRLADDYPVVTGIHFEKARERIALSPTVLAHGIVEGVVGFVGRSSACKASHGKRLRTKEGCGSLGQHESAGLTLHHGHQCLVTSANGQ